MSLPTGHTLRPPRRDEVDSAHAVFTAAERSAAGSSLTLPSDIEHEWSMPGFDRDRDAWVVEAPDGRLAAVAWLNFGHLAIEVAVGPEARGQGIGTALLPVLEERAREVFGPGALLKQLVRGSNDAARHLLAAAGYEPKHRYTRMRIELEAPPAQPALPDGVQLRPMIRGADDRAVWEIDTAAFGPSPDYEPMPLERFAADHLAFPAIVFEASPVAVAHGEPIGFALNEMRGDMLGFVGILAVRPDWQHRGLGRALLLRSFADLAAHGARAVELGVLGSNERAWALYRSAGMSPGPIADRYEKRLG